MGCEQTPLIRTEPMADDVAARLAICESCTYNVNDVCKVVAMRHPDHATVSHGVKRLSLRCPLGKWGPIPTTCPECTRGDVILNASGVCKWCDLSGVRYQRDHTIKPDPFPREPVKNLHYFIYPVFEESTHYHLEQLRASVDQFNGRRVCCVATDETTVHEPIMRELKELFTDVYTVPNDPKKREVVGFVPSLMKLYSERKNEAICFAHAKGQQEHTHDDDTIRKWVDAMYATVVRNWAEVREAMERGYPLAGAFKSIGQFRSTIYKWHFSGTFYWIRSHSLFRNPKWKETCGHFWGAESYPGRHWHADEGYCLFGGEVANMLSLYDPTIWENRLSEELRRWKLEKEECRDASIC